MQIFRKDQAKKDNNTLSLGKTKDVCGYEIKKMPLGAYLRALKRVETLPEDILGKLFPGKETQEIVDGLTKFDKTMLMEAARAAFFVVPEHAVAFVAELTGVDADALLNDPGVGLVGFLDIIQAFIEVNALGEFRSRLTQVVTAIRATTKTGYKV